MVMKKGRSVFLVTSDKRKVIAKLEIVATYHSPRHWGQAVMVMYRATIDGEEFVGRSAGMILVMRRGRKF